MRFCSGLLGGSGLRLNQALRSVGLAALLCLFLCGVAYAISICGSCGYEGGDDARFCSHCGAGLKTEGGGRGSEVGGRGSEVGGRGSEVGGRETEVGGRGSEVGGWGSEVGGWETGGSISAEAVADDMRTARLHLKAERVELARMFGRNALALNLLAGEDPGQVRSKAILEFLEQSDRLSGLARRACPACDGAGKAVMTARLLDGSTRDLQVTGRECDRCGGAGIIRGKETIDERKYRQGQAGEQYRTIQQSRGRQPVGAAWVPADAGGKLGVAETVMLKRAIPPACSRCAGLGRDDCSDCRGSGKVTCEADGCERGWVERESLGGRIGGSRSAGKTIHKVRCESCNGVGLERCEDCSGAGSFLCKTCNGEGFAKLCSKCGGAGIGTCRRCAGSRVYRGEACSYCRAEGITECSSCGGTGRKR
jgi:hypothetical protein